MDNLSELTQAAQLAVANTQRRDALILEARLDDYQWGAIAAAAGLSIVAVQNTAKRLNGGVMPKPRKEP